MKNLRLLFVIRQASEYAHGSIDLLENDDSSKFMR